MNKPLKDSLQGPFYDLKEDDEIEIEEDIEQEGDIITERNVRIGLIFGVAIGNLLIQRFCIERSWTDALGISILTVIVFLVLNKIVSLIGYLLTWMGLRTK